MRIKITAIILLFTAMLIHSVCFAEDFTLTTTGFADSGAMPTLYTCDGKNISPQLTWTKPPEKTKAFALIMSDPDAQTATWYHWVLFNIPAKTNELGEGIEKLPGTTLSGKNSWNKLEYSGPCPPKNSVHNYIFTLYALDTLLPLPAGSDAKKVIAAAEKHTIKKIQLTGVYSRWLN